MLEVNPNTIMRSYEYLQQNEIIYTKRGMGYFVQANAAKNILKTRQEQFINEELPQLFKKMQLLNIPVNQLQESYNQFINVKN